MTSQKQAQRPVTYGNIFNVKGGLASQPVTKEDASLMQSAETLVTGQTKKHGAASVMQSSADKNIQSGAINADSHSTVPQGGVEVIETAVPGRVEVAEYVAGKEVTKEVMASTEAVTAKDDPITIGEALEVAAVGFCDKPVESSDARAIQSACARATGMPVPVKGDVAATAQAAADVNPRVEDVAKTTVGDILMDASAELESDKFVTQEDANKARKAELRGMRRGGGTGGAISTALQAAADHNAEAAALTHGDPN